MYEYKGIVVKVVDGDTVDIQVDLGFKISREVRVRLYEIDTPEIYHPSCQAELEHGRAAKLFVEDKILGKPVTVVTYKDKTGKYGRYLADIAYTDENGRAFLLTDELIDKGYEKKVDY